MKTPPLIPSLISDIFMETVENASNVLNVFKTNMRFLGIILITNYSIFEQLQIFYYRNYNIIEIIIEMC